MNVQKIYINGPGAIQYPANDQHKFIIELGQAIGLTNDDRLFIIEENQFNKELSKYEIVYRIYFLTYDRNISLDLGIHTEEKKALNIAESFVVEKYNTMRALVSRAQSIVVKGYLNNFNEYD